ncbi:MAG: metallophosphoesterase [bacterium]|nr:metallophosphoesterase [bacterium]
MRISFFVFIAIASLIVASAHAGIFFSFVKFFQIGSGPLRKVLLGAMLPLAFSFIITSMLVHTHENVITRFFYIISAGWLGIFLYLTMATVVCWVVFLVVKAIGVNVSAVWLTAPIYFVALLFSLYGFWNAANPVLKNVTVNIENLPERWKGRTIVQASDIHLGAINRSGFAQQVVNLINSANPDVVVITGDLFDGAGEDLSHLVEPLNQIQAPLGVYFITGNHETYVGLQKSFDALQSTKVRMLRDEIVDLDGVQLVGIDYLTIGSPEKLDSIVAQINPAQPSVVLFHEPRFVEVMKKAGVNLQLAGHTHRGQMWPFNYITKRVYNGLDYGLYTDGSYNLYTSCGAGTWGPPLRSGNRPEVVGITLQQINCLKLESL